MIQEQIAFKGASLHFPAFCLKLLDVKPENIMQFIYAVFRC